MAIEKQYKTIKLSNIIPYGRNNKVHDANVDRIVDSIKRNEYITPIVINGEGVILAGHGRKMALEKMGETEVEVLQVTGLTKKQEADFRISDNRTSELSEWDFDAVIEEIEEFELEELKIDFPDMEFDIADLDEENEDTVPEMDDVEIIVERGDVFQLGEHRLMCGDSTNIEDVEKLMDGQKADLYTDPPYGIAVVKGGRVGTGDFGVAKKGEYSDVIGDNTTDTAKDVYNLASALGCEKMIIRGGNYFTEFLPPSKGWIIRDKRGNSGIRNSFADGEIAWTNDLSPVRIYTQLWNGMIREGESGKRVHPTQKPLRTQAEILDDYRLSNVLDLFLGSGSTLIACEKTKRKCYGMEIDGKYIQVILKRYYDYTKGQKEIKCLNRGLDLSPILQDG